MTAPRGTLHWGDGSVFMCTEEETQYLVDLHEETEDGVNEEAAAAVVAEFNRLNQQRHRVMDAIWEALLPKRKPLPEGLILSPIGYLECTRCNTSFTCFNSVESWNAMVEIIEQHMEAHDAEGS